MSQRGACLWLVLLVGWSFVACNAADIAVFSAAAAGNAGSARSAGIAGGSTAGGGADSSASGASGGAVGGLDAGMDAGDDAGAFGVSCLQDQDCDAGSFCERQGCNAPSGTCVAKPMVCFDTAPKNVCGCDHRTYWNDCLRQQYGVSAHANGECGGGALACDTSSDCGVHGSCTHLLTPSSNCSGPASPGRCWVTPDDCSMTGDTRRWAQCPPPGVSPAGAPCVSTCQAIQSGVPFQPLGPNDACP